jgi:hypothetical protein
LLPVTRRQATLAQSVEQLIRNQQVVGSNPTGGSKEIQELRGFSVPQAHISWSRMPDGAIW